ncbi:uncharacterized protein L3040_005359 [Drepanopeziza brunnea f. sp. 'multigermtubi']|uniref:Protein AkeP n=1 Tax=Marssonina brunnea f. sp. multigermtubi (strain MB_m1) TaxID=1072389 RepID=K1X8W9_MARBU|nr:protein AkeP [Drepanopeziza brunnea f. sp. 'multigermtubi' MB_m1]EKD17138.1 protein AkeP [Drepanopeziza brunnea f. sp. 'multigermtubi' MB_m1]KAJ5041792.1 hypothetical protein L3040_005359 [Drepanopeziza brunnea f. sp. 'multigermtubi']
MVQLWISMLLPPLIHTSLVKAQSYSTSPFNGNALAYFQSLANGQTILAPIVSIHPNLTRVLPFGFSSNTNLTFVNGTTTPDDTHNSLFSKAKSAALISYSDEFLALVGPNPQATLVERRDSLFAFEAGAWIPEKRQVWFTSAVQSPPVSIFSLDLDTNAVTQVNSTGDPIISASGGYFFEGAVYFGTSGDFIGNAGQSGGVVKVDVNTLRAETVVSSYFGLRVNVDDVAWVTQGETGKKYMFFSSIEYVKHGCAMASSVSQYDPQENFFRPVISATDIGLPNGVRASLDGKSLYVTDFAGTKEAALLNRAADGVSAVYKYDLDADMLPVNRRLFSYTRQGIADGIHVDASGRVWTAEGEGIVVRSPAGKVLGMFNVQFFTPEHAADLPISNFALAGDELVVLGGNYLWRVKLAQAVVSVMN